MNELEESKEVSNGGLSWLMHMRLVLSEIERLIREIERLDKDRKELCKENNGNLTTLQDKLDQKILDLRKDVSLELVKLREDITKIKEAVLTLTIKIAIATAIGTFILASIVQMLLKKWIE
jgi:uncharacterized protein (UPF0335 family)